MSSIARVEGPNLTLRLIEPDDAAYVAIVGLLLRNQPLYNSHLSKVTGTVASISAQWIEGYKAREVRAGKSFTM